MSNQAITACAHQDTRRAHTHGSSWQGSTLAHTTTYFLISAAHQAMG